MCEGGKCELVCTGCQATEEGTTFLEAYERAREAGWGMTGCGLLLCAACVRRVTTLAARRANAILN